MSGSEKLLGNGDMLFLGNGLNKPKRIQGCFVSDKELEDLVKYLREEQEPQYDESILQFKSSKGGHGSLGEAGGEDDMYEDAVKVVVDAGKASASLLQRRLRVGYARAARLLDILEGNGIITPADGAKPRDVLIFPGEESNYLSQNGHSNVENQNITTRDHSSTYNNTSNGYINDDYTEVEKDYK